MEIHADWKHCTIDDFASLNIEDNELFESLLTDHLISQHSPEDERKLNTLKSKLLFIIHNTF